MQKKPIDIEALLQWTFRDELPKGRPVAASAWDNIQHYCVLGTRVDSSYRSSDSLGFTHGEPHDDAKVVAAIVRSLSNDQSFATVGDVRALMRDFEVPVIGERGEAIVANRLCPPGGVVERELFALNYNVQSAVIAHAVQASRPIHTTDSLKPRAKLGRDGRVMLEGRKGGGRYSNGAFTWLEYSRPTIEQFFFARASYRVWLNALHWLAHELAGKLENHEPLAPAAAHEPWISGEAPRARIIASLLPARRLVPAQRPRAGRPAPSYRLGKAVPAAA